MLSRTLHERTLRAVQSSYYPIPPLSAQLGSDGEEVLETVDEEPGLLGVDRHGLGAGRAVGRRCLLSCSRTLRPPSLVLCECRALDGRRRCTECTVISCSYNGRWVEIRVVADESSLEGSKVLGCNRSYLC